VDRQVINLTRFPLFFPEQRVFFTEGAGIFDFGRPQQSQMFYSRRIGLSDTGEPVPLLAGVRLNGRIGGEQVGLLAARTGGSEQATDIVLRVKHDVVGRGYVGALATLNAPRGQAASPAYGMDFYLPYIVGGQNVVINGNVAAHQDSLSAQPATHARIVFDYPNDEADIVLRADYVDAGYAPKLGFVSEAGITRIAGGMEFSPRPGWRGVRKVYFGVPTWDIVHNLDRTLSHATVTASPVGVEFESGAEIDLGLTKSIDVPVLPFDIFPGHTITPGRYEWNRAQLDMTTSPARPIVLEMSLSHGGFYGGTSTQLDGVVRGTVTARLLASLETSLADVQRVAGGFQATTVRLRTDYAWSPRLNTTFFGQWDNESERVAFNARVRWSPAPGSDLYVVWNSAWPSALPNGVPWLRPQRGGLVVKYVLYARS
jgi:hypothetical protein